MNKITIPSDETTYWCSIHKFSEVFKQKQHVVRYESVIQTGNEQLVHHMELFHCEVNSSQEMPEYNGPCAGPKVPPILSKCRKVIAAWAMGATVSIFFLLYFFKLMIKILLHFLIIFKKDLIKL